MSDTTQVEFESTSTTSVGEDKRIFGTVLYDFVCNGYNILSTHYEDGVQYFTIDDKKFGSFVFVLRHGCYGELHGLWLDVVSEKVLDTKIINTLVFNNRLRLFVKFDYYIPEGQQKFTLNYSFANIKKFLCNIRKHRKFINYYQNVSFVNPIKIK